LSKEIGRRLKTLAAERKLRQTELAARMGMDYGHLNQVLNGHRPVYAEELPRYAVVLGVSLEAILGLEEK
jgi:transcriptional regulator with XRE-family HTH domain